MLDALGFEALATSSGALAFTLGHADGEANLDDVVEHVAALTAATPLPVSVDLENGYGPHPRRRRQGRRLARPVVKGTSPARTGSFRLPLETGAAG